MPTGLSNAISGLSNFQRLIDVVGNNIANLNTPGYKYSNVTFKELMAQTLKGASSSTSAHGGLNPMQLGLGTTLAAIELSLTQGPIEITGKPTDMAITGSGYFVLRNAGNTRYSRHGNFALDGNGDLVDPSGMKVMGWRANSSGVIDPSGGMATLESINIPIGQSVTARATTSVDFAGNLDASVATGDTHATKVTAYDAMGGATEVTLTFTKIDNTDASWPAGAAAAWKYAASGPGGTSGTGVVAYNSSGMYDQTKSTIGSITFTPANGAAVVSITPNLKLTTQFDTDISSLVARNQDGAKAGSLETFTVYSNGNIVGNYTNGTTQNIAQVALASFSNPQGLTKVEGGLFIESANSGIANVGTANTGSRGSINASALEQSNVDLGSEFTKMIIAQRAFQANSRIVTAYDEILSEVANLKR
jgi:flagellar hook protein FlgE